MLLFILFFLTAGYLAFFLKKLLPLIWFIAFFALIFVDLMRLRNTVVLAKKSFDSWDSRFQKNEFYSFLDFVIVDLNKIKFYDVIKFLIISNLHKIMSYCQMLSAFDWFIISFFWNITLKKKNNSIIYLLFVTFPQALALALRHRLRTKTVTIEEGWIFAINALFLVLIRRSRWNINNSLFFLNNVNEIKKDPNWPAQKNECLRFIIKISIADRLQDLINKIDSTIRRN